MFFQRFPFEVVVILGRGIQRRAEADPVEDVNSYVLTDDIELCDKDSAHLPVHVPADDDSPFCMVGGGKMNFDAGLRLIYSHQPKVVVCAYGGRSKYLETIGGPSESEVMSRELIQAIRTDLDIATWRPELPEVGRHPGPGQRAHRSKRLLTSPQPAASPCGRS